MEKPKVVEIPELPVCEIECADCGDPIEEAPYYLRLHDAAFICILCKEAAGYKSI